MLQLKTAGKVSIFATFRLLFILSFESQMKKARKPDKINVFGLAGDSETRTHDPLNAIGISGFL